mmetsp:Transcript_159670/g.291372  ORF Transcript_159670/g.291372 Transcript_159670/m.291372 type:complete len:594 (+) Transcript_159670:96-1877(+)
MVSVRHAILAGILGCAMVCHGLWNTEPDTTVTFFVYWAFPAGMYEVFKSGTAEFVTLTKKEPGNKFYGFTLRETTAVCKEGYQSGQAFLDHLTNVEKPLGQTLVFAEITKIEVHGPESEFHVLLPPLAAFSVTYWSLVPSSFYVPAHWKTVADTTVTLFSYYDYADGNRSHVEAIMAGVITLTKEEPGNLFYGWAHRDTGYVIKDCYVNAQAYLDHVLNMQQLRQNAAKVYSLTKVEVHGPAKELEKLKTVLSASTTTYWAAEQGAFYMPCNYGSSSGPAQDDSLAFKVHWTFAADKYADFQARIAVLISLTKTEAGCLYYGFTMQNTTAVTKGGHQSAQALLDHLDNIYLALQKTFPIAQVTGWEVYGPATELEKLKEPLAAFPVSYWASDADSFYVPARYLPALDTTVAVMVHWEFSAESSAAFKAGTVDFVKLTKTEPETVYYGFTLLETTAVCKEGYKSAQGFLDHLANIDEPLNEALKIASITKIEVHGPAEELSHLTKPLEAFPVTYWPLEPGAFRKQMACDTPVFYSDKMKKTTCGSLKTSYGEEKCCGAPGKAATSLKMTCSAARSQYGLEGCCGVPSKEIMLLE